MNEQEFVEGYLELPRTDFKLKKGVEYKFFMYGEKEVPVGKKTILNFPSQSGEGGVPEAIIVFTGYEFGMLGNDKATKVNFTIEDFLC